MPARCAFEYAILRVVPEVAREEFVNAGAIVLCAERGHLAARVELDERRLLALAPDVDVALVRAHLDAVPRICAGGEGAGPMGHLPLVERFRWLVAPRNTIVQMSPPHAGVCDEPAAVLDRLVATVVRRATRA